ncbi:MAG: hypothetical protein M5U19_08260 [Microthrixaceae bacterium]|nr:hypothetical protein [Microthrixaceae bacterium]
MIRAAGTSRAADLQALSTVVLDALEKPVGFGTRRERRRYGSAARRAHRRLAAGAVFTPGVPSPGC